MTLNREQWRRICCCQDQYLDLKHFNPSIPNSEHCIEALVNMICRVHRVKVQVPYWGLSDSDISVCGAFW